jgi:6-pyruvoyltetrahydropterin/6-carboxytetrahydropterin synthase
MKAYFHRRYHLSASHRLHTAALSTEANRVTYGKCNNPFGHGHNYVVELCVSGQVDPATGMVINLADLDLIAEREILSRHDHTNLNTLKDFENRVPTTENLCIAIFDRVAPAISGAQLEKVRVEETGKNFFEYSGRQQEFPHSVAAD